MRWRGRRVRARRAVRFIVADTPMVVSVDRSHGERCNYFETAKSEETRVALATPASLLGEGMIKPTLLVGKRQDQYSHRQIELAGEMLAR